MLKCPGQDTRYWKPEDIFDVPCPVCDTGVEFLKTDRRRKCANCGYSFRNPRLELGCAQWCAYAEECLGFVPEKTPLDSERGPVVDRLITGMKDQFGNDYKRIAHALLVLQQAQELLREEDGDPRVVLAAAVLHDIGIQEAERKYGSSASQCQEIEGPPLARRIMEETGLDEPTIQHVCRIVGSHHSAGDIDTPEFRILWDSDWLVNLPEELTSEGGKHPADIVEKIFKTSSGKKKAYELFAKKETIEPISPSPRW